MRLEMAVGGGGVHTSFSSSSSSSSPERSVATISCDRTELPQQAGMHASSSSSSQQHPVLSLPRQVHVPKEVASAAAGAYEATPAGEGVGIGLEEVSGKTGAVFRV